MSISEGSFTYFTITRKDSSPWGDPSGEPLGEGNIIKDYTLVMEIYQEEGLYKLRL